MKDKTERKSRLTEAKLITRPKVAAMLGVGEKTFKEYEPQITARHGLIPIPAGKRVLYSAAAVEKLTQKLANTGDALYVTEQRGFQR